MEFKIGDTYQILKPPMKGVKVYKIHILAIVDDSQVVYKFFGKHKQWWHYLVQDTEMLALDIEHCKDKTQELA